jgi:hypothetical protein
LNAARQQKKVGRLTTRSRFILSPRLDGGEATIGTLFSKGEAEHDGTVHISLMASDLSAMSHSIRGRKVVCRP